MKQLSFAFFIVMLATSLIGQTDPLEIIGHWTFSEMSGDSIYDISGNDNNGYIGGAIWAEGYGGGALRFDGNGSIIISIATLPIGNAPRTLEAIIYANETISDSYVTGWGSWYTEGTWYLNTWEDNYRVVTYNNDVQVSGAEDSTWMHLAAVYDGTTASLYLNHELIGSRSIDINTGLSDFYIGGTTYGAQFDGEISEIRLSGIALEPDQFLNTPAQYESLVAYYPFNGDANDESGHGNHGDVQGPILSEDRFGNVDAAYSFDGSNDFILINYSDDFNSPDSITVCAWVNFETGGGVTPRIISYGNSQWDLMTRFNSGSRGFGFGINGETSFETANQFTTGTWYFVCGVKSSTHRRIYVNAQLEAEQIHTQAIDISSNPINIGRYPMSNWGNEFKGIIDDVRIYTCVLNSSEIDSLYHLDGWDTQETGTVTDIDGNVYQTIQIGDQEWMAANLNVTHYRNGDAIPNLLANGEWSTSDAGAFCYYNNDVGNAETYGALYNWFALTDPRELAPEGWHIPTDDEWNALELYLGMSQSEVELTGIRGTVEGGKLKEPGDIHWISPNEGATNESGFTALPGSNRNPNSGIFDHAGSTGYGTSIWTSTSYDDSRAYWRNLTYNSSQIGREYSYSNNKRSGFSIRCVKDTEDFDLVAYYPFNGNADDESGNGYDGVQSGDPTIISDRTGNANSAYQFDGVDDHIAIPYTPAMHPTEQITVSAFANLSEYSSYQMIVNCVYQGGWALSVHNGSVRIDLQFPADDDRIVVPFSLADYPVDKWFHVVGTYDGSNVSLYFNGELKAQTPITGQIRYDHNNSTFIGAAAYTGSSPLDGYDLSGMVDEIKVYSRALTLEEITEQYHEGMIELEVGLVPISHGENILVPINVTFPDDELYRSAELNFSGYMDGLDFVGVETAGSMLEGLDWFIEENETETMLLTAYAGTSGISGSGVFCYLEFTATGENCSTIPINVDYAKFNSNEWVESISGGVTIVGVPDYGDVDYNGTIEALDASDILLHVLDGSYLDCQGIANADVYLDGIIDGMDASIILQYLVELVPELPVIPSEAFIASGNLSTEDQEAVANTVVSIPFSISEGENIYAFEGSITYDPEAVIPDEEPVTWSTLLDGFMISTEADNGVIRFVGAGANPDGAEGVFLTANFLLNENVEIGAHTTITLSEMKFNSNLVLENVSANIAFVVSLDPITIPDQFVLQQNYPNPFNPSTTIKYGLPEEANVSVVIYDVRGQVVQTMTSEHQSAGWYDVTWYGETTDGKQISTGIYFARLVAGEYSQVIKMLYLR